MIPLPNLPWKLIGAGAVAIVIAVLVMLWKGEQRHSAKLQGQVVKLSSELQRISTKRNEQKEVTTQTIEKVVVEYREAEKRAERIEAAPLPGNCATPREIMGADL